MLPQRQEIVLIRIFCLKLNQEEPELLKSLIAQEVEVIIFMVINNFPDHINPK